MLQNYIKIAWRHLWKNKVFSFINIFGLSVGIAFTLLTAAYIWSEVRINRDLKDAGNQYIVLSKWKDPNTGPDIATIAQLTIALKDYPTLVRNTYHFDGITSVVSKRDMHFRESMQIGDSTILSMYGFKLQQGNAITAFNDPYSVVITGRMAEKYFGRTNVVGQTLNFESFKGSRHDFIISGVLGDIPQNSVTNLNAENNSGFFFPAGAASFFGVMLDQWNNMSMVTYLELQPGTDPRRVEQVIQQLVKKNEPENVAKTLNLVLVNLKDYNLQADNGLVRKMIITLSSIALFILLMAVINFVNICIGRSSGRMKEMGVRKVAGSLRNQLVWQFLAESVVMVFLATVFALVIFMLARPYFSDMLGVQISSLFALPLLMLPVLVLFILIVGLLAGIYPALVLSGLSTIDALKGKAGTVKENALLKKSLVGFQFAIAGAVFIGALIVTQQVDLFFKNDLGYDKNYIVYAQLPRDWSAAGVKRMEAAARQFEQMPQVGDVSLSYEIPNGMNGSSFPVYKPGQSLSQGVTCLELNDDSHFAATYSIPLKAGSFFSPVYQPADSTHLVINETAAKALGWRDPKDAIGQKIVTPFTATPFTVSGVVADFHFSSLRDRIQPIVITNVNYWAFYRFFSIKIKPGNVHESISALQNKWAELFPGSPFEYHFMDDALAKMYINELHLRKAAYTAAVLAVVIALLGVLGLVALSIQKRTKEIGIRKVLGSSVAGITALFLKDFMTVVVVAGLVACPVAWIVMQRWLQGYAYRVNITMMPFIVSVGILMLMTVVLIILQTTKAALTKPVESLRNNE
jgi:putative ABC transport system permease protein